MEQIEEEWISGQLMYKCDGSVAIQERNKLKNKKTKKQNN